MREVRQILIRSFTSAGIPPASRDRSLQAFHHREGMGKNWRSHRRGYGRRFIFRHLNRGRCSPEHWELAVLILGIELQLLQFWGSTRTADPPFFASLKRRNDNG
jgi:hypothetical protein